MDEANSPEQGPEQDTPEPKLPSFGERLLAVFVEPKVVFDYVAKRNDFWWPFLTAAILGIIAAVLMLPALSELMVLQAQARGGTELSSSMIKGFSYAAVVISPISLAVYLLLIACLLWVVVLILSGASEFGKALSVAAWSYCPVALGSLLNSIVLAIARPELPNIQAAQQHLTPIFHYTSLSALVALNAPIVGTMLAVISLFTVWNLWLLWIGARRSMRGTVTSATAFVVIFLLAKLGKAAFDGWQISKTL